MTIVEHKNLAIIFYNGRSFFYDESSHPLKIKESFYDGKKVGNSILPCFSVPITQAIAPMLSHLKTK
jgi:hypothetical protein